MYQFSTAELAGLQVAQTVAKAGTNHKKVYATTGVTPATQDTLNVYVSGSFRFDCGTFTQTLMAGQTSLDLTIPEYPAGEICEETVLSPWGMRFCVSSKKPWARDALELQAGQSYQPPCDGVVVLTAGELQIGGSMLRHVAFRLAPKGSQVAAVTPSSLLFCRLS